MPPLIMKLAMPVSSLLTLSRKRERGTRSRYASFTLTVACKLLMNFLHPMINNLRCFYAASHSMQSIKNRRIV